MNGYREFILPRWLARAWRWVYRVFLRAKVDAVTVGHSILYMDDWGRDGEGDVCSPLDLWRHETWHVYQCIQYEERVPGPYWFKGAVGRLWFWAVYLWEMRKGYRANRFEVEARRAAGQE